MPGARMMGVCVRGVVAQEGLWSVPHVVTATRPSDKLN